MTRKWGGGRHEVGSLVVGSGLGALVSLPLRTRCVRASCTLDLICYAVPLHLIDASIQYKVPFVAFRSRQQVPPERKFQF